MVANYDASTNQRPALTLADALDAVAADEILPLSERKQLKSSLVSFSRLVGQPIESIPADPRILRQLFEATSPAKTRHSRSYFANLKCRVMKSLRVGGVHVLSGRCMTALRADWEELLGAAPPNHRRFLLTFVRFCHERNLSPSEVTQQTFDQFEDEVERRSSRSNPRKRFLAVCRIWNACGDAVDCWPPFRVQIIHRFDRYDATDLLPSTFHVEVDRMLSKLATVDLLSPIAQRSLKDASIKNRRYSVYRLASACVAGGVPPSELSSLRQLVDPTRVRLGLGYILNRLSRPTSGTHKLAEAIVATARDHTDLPADDLAKLRMMRNNLRVNHSGMTEKNRATIRCFEDERMVEAFLEFPGKAVRQLAKKKILNRLEALRLQDALIVDLLTFAPVRISNLSAIQFGRNLVRVGSGQEAQWHLVFAREEVKNGEGLEFRLSRSTCSLIEMYTRLAMPLLAPRGSKFLFPGSVDGHKQPAEMSSRLAKLMFKKVGVRLTAHQFRHLAGFLFLKQYPGQYEIVRLLLGHKSITTTMKFYVGMEQAAAVTAWDRFLNDRRATLASS